ncbi:MAG: type II secretion system protein GspK [Planctomycetota bacterium]|nr:type II secretion system protein GspK [Planctomycetota bacterium]
MSLHEMSNRRASVIVVVLWAIALAAIVTSAVQLTAFRQAMQGREAFARTQTRWAARAGLEDTIAVLADHTFDPIPDDAFAMIYDLEDVALGEVEGASYEILHHVNGRDFKGPMDEHSRFNIHHDSQRGRIMQTFRNMRIDIPSSISDWIDDDDEPSTFGVEREYYLSLAYPYEPRNGPMHNMAELELIAGIWPEYVRGEDWNFNNRLDPEENDGALSLPEDEPDGILEPGWAARLTTFSLAEGATGTGLPRLELRHATIDELVDRLGVSERHAEMLIGYGNGSETSLESLYFSPISGTSSNPASIGQSGSGTQNLGQSSRNSQPSGTPNQNQGQSQSGSRNQSSGESAMQEILPSETVDLILSETTLNRPYERHPGKMNINTVEADFLREMFPDHTDIADEIIYLRNSRPQGIVSISELQDLPEMTDDMFQIMLELFTTTSNIYTVTSRGISKASGLEVEMIVVVDRSTLPVRIIEYREQ